MAVWWQVVGLACFACVCEGQVPSRDVRVNSRDPLLKSDDWVKSLDESRVRNRDRHRLAIEDQNLLQFFQPVVLEPPKMLKDARRIKLDNGMTVLIKQVKTSPTVAVQMWHKIGSHNETEQVNGISHLLEHLLFKGTVSRPVQFMRLFDVMGAEVNAFTSNDVTVYHEIGEKETLKHMLTLEHDRLTNWKINAEQLEHEKVVVLSELAGYDDNALTGLDDQVMAATFPVPGYGLPVGGHPAVVSAITLEQVRSHYVNNYGPDGAVLVIAGDVDMEEASNLVVEIFDSKPLEARPEVQHMIMLYVWWAHYVEASKPYLPYSPYVAVWLNYILMYLWTMVYKATSGWDVSWVYNPAAQARLDDARAGLNTAKNDLSAAIRTGDPDVIMEAQHRVQDAEDAVKAATAEVNPVPGFLFDGGVYDVESDRMGDMAAKEHAMSAADHHIAKILAQGAAVDMRFENPGYVTMLKKSVYAQLGNAMQQNIAAKQQSTVGGKAASAAMIQSASAGAQTLLQAGANQVTPSGTIQPAFGDAHEISMLELGAETADGPVLLTDDYIEHLKAKAKSVGAHRPPPPKDGYIDSLRKKHNAAGSGRLENEGLQSLVSVAQNSFYGGKSWLDSMNTVMQFTPPNGWGSTEGGTFVLSDQPAIVVQDQSMQSSAIIQITFPLTDITYASDMKSVVVVLDEIVSGGHMSLLGRYLVSHNVSWNGVSTELASHLDCGWYKIIVSVIDGPDELIKAEEAVAAMVRDIRLYDLDGDDLDRAKLNVMMAHLEGEGDLEELAEDIGRDYMFTGDTDFTMKYYNAMLRVTLRNIREFAKRFFREKMARIGVLTPVDTEAGHAYAGARTRSVNTLMDHHVWQAHPHSHLTGMVLGQERRVTQSRSSALLGDNVLVQTSVGDPSDASGYSGEGFDGPSELLAFLPPLPSLVNRQPLQLDMGKTVRLSNGLKVTLIPQNSKVIRVSGRVEAGAINDPIGKSGIASVVANMLLKGSTSFSYTDFVVNLDDDASRLEYKSMREQTSISAIAFTKNFQRLLTIIVESLAYPSFDPDLFEMVKASLAAGSDKASMSHDDRAKQLMQRGVFPAGHPYHTFPTLASIAAMTRDDVVEFHKTLYRPKNTVLVVTGDFDINEMVAMLEKAFSTWNNENLYRLEATGKNCLWNLAEWEGIDPDCEDRCTKDPSCNFYTADETGLCQLRSMCRALGEAGASMEVFAKRSAVKPSYDMVGVLKTCSDGNLYLGVDEECADRCAADHRCNFYTYYPDSRYCATHETCQYKVDSSDGTSRLYARLKSDVGGVVPISDVSFPAVAEASDTHTIEVDGATNVVSLFGKQGLPRCSDDWHVLAIASRILGGNPLSSRLGTHVRDNNGLTYGVYSYVEAGIGAGLLLIRMQTAPDQTTEAINEVYTVLRDFVEHGVSDIEVDIARRQLLASHTMSLSTPQNVGDMLATMAQCDGQQGAAERLQNIPNNILSITTERVNAYIREHLNVDKFRLVRVGAPVQENSP